MDGDDWSWEEIQVVHNVTEVKDEMWSTKEISTDYDVWAELMPDVTMSVKGDIIADCNKFYNFLDIRNDEVDVEINTSMEEFICYIFYLTLLWLHFFSSMIT